MYAVEVISHVVPPPARTHTHVIRMSECRYVQSAFCMDTVEVALMFLFFMFILLYLMNI